MRINGQILKGAGVAQSSEIDKEQCVVDTIYNHFDDLVNRTKKRLSDVRAQGGTGSPTHIAERDSFATLYEDRVDALRSAEDRLVFGRLDMKQDTSPDDSISKSDNLQNSNSSDTPPSDNRSSDNKSNSITSTNSSADDTAIIAPHTHYIGRIGLLDSHQEPLLTDWRAEAARAFYEATPKNPMNVERRRHISLSMRKVKGIEDEILDADSIRTQIALKEGTLQGEGSLIAALSEKRTSTMRDIVATIQAEQDQIIRAPLQGLTVVQGGPGTGKTAVALHRAAYLLYTHRERLEHSGVLIIGPSQSFLHYISNVLPSLGETGVISQTFSTLLPDIKATQEDNPATAQLKGDLRMQDVLKRAVRSYVRIPPQLSSVNVMGFTIPLSASDIEMAQQEALRSSEPHNQQRHIFVETFINLLTERIIRDYVQNTEASTTAEVRRELFLDRSLKNTLNLAWLPLTAPWLLKKLFSKPELLDYCSPCLSQQEKELLYRSTESDWSISDIPLLDELMNLIGMTADEERQTRQQKREEDQLDQQLAEAGLAPNSALARRVREDLGNSRYSSVALHARQDRLWTYGHIVVDEAQELTPMQWKMLQRRCPSRSFTVVGDIAQTTSLGGTREWEHRLNVLFGENSWKLYTLTVDYRNPQEIALLAQNFAEREGLICTTTSAPRAVPHSLIHVKTEEADLLTTVAQQTQELITTYLHKDGSGQIAIISPHDLNEAVKSYVTEEYVADTNTYPFLLSQLHFLQPDQSKGLEYDAVILINPGHSEQEAPTPLVGASNIYVALTRATQRLVLVQTPTDCDLLSL